MFARSKRFPGRSMPFAFALIAALCAYSTLSFSQPSSADAESRAALEYEQAVNEWKATNNRSEIGPDIHVLLGVTLMESQRYEVAVVAFEEAKTLIQTTGSAHYTSDENRYAILDSFLGTALVGAGRYEEALEPLSYSLRVRPNNGDGFYARAWAYGSLNRLEESAADVESALQLHPNNQRYLDLQAELSAVLAQRPSASEMRAQTEFVSEMAEQSGARTTESGMVYFVNREGSGPSPQATDTVRILYRGTDINGQVFDAFEEGTAGRPLELRYLIQCLQEGIQMMRVGGKRRLVCPANLAYGDNAVGQMKPGSTVIYDVELVGIE